MKCIIVDDNPMALTALKQMIEEVDYLDLQASCNAAMEAFNVLEKTQVDLMFLDVEMPNMTGLELMQSLTKKPLVIMITSKENYALEAFQLHVVDYLVKPVTFQRFLQAVQYAHELFQKKHPNKKDFIFVKEVNEIVRLVLSDILFVQALGDYIQIVTPQKKHTIHLTMKVFKAQLPAQKFLQVHRSYIVAVDKIESIKDNMIVIQKNVIPVSNTYKNDLLQNLNLL